MPCSNDLSFPSLRKRAGVKHHLSRREGQSLRSVMSCIEDISFVRPHTSCSGTRYEALVFGIRSSAFVVCHSDWLCSRESAAQRLSSPTLESRRLGKGILAEGNRSLPSCRCQPRRVPCLNCFSTKYLGWLLAFCSAQNIARH